MNLSEYQTISARTAPTDLCDKERRTNAAWGLIGEFGEVVDVMKKGRFQGASKCGCQHPDVEDFFYINNICLRCSGDGINQAFRDRLRDEFGDVMWYLAEVATICGYELRCHMRAHSTRPIDVMCSIVELCLHMRARCANEHDLREVLNCVCCLITEHGFTQAEVLEHNVSKLRVRYPDGFTVAASINRGAM